jgi:beta-amylase
MKVSRVLVALLGLGAASRKRRRYVAEGASSNGAEVFVMMPLTTVSNGGGLSNQGHLAWQLDKVRDTGADGFMIDVWWGLTEKSSKSYDFGAYEEIVRMAEQRGLLVQFVASFHQCGGNVGDDCFIPLPEFVRQNSDIWYTDQHGNANKEYISLFADNVKLNDGRTPLEMYADWFAALNSVFQAKIPGTVMEVQVGMGPAGELRYPGYYMGHGWNYPGIGEFQVYDKFARQSLRESAPPGTGWTDPPSDAGSYNSKPWETGFFGGGYRSEYGKFFLGWYMDKLKEHGRNVLSRAKAVWGNRLILAGKISGIHWWYRHPSHAAELTTGYYNTNNRDAYAEMADVFKSLNATLDFTCLEMRNSEQNGADNGPEDLVAQVRGAAMSKGIMFNGENALPRYDWTAYEQILTSKWALTAFTYLRLTDHLVQGGFDNFKRFVDEMHR